MTDIHTIYPKLFDFLFHLVYLFQLTTNPTIDQMKNICIISHIFLDIKVSHQFNCNNRLMFQNEIFGLVLYPLYQLKTIILPINNSTIKLIANLIYIFCLS